MSKLAQYFIVFLFFSILPLQAITQTTTINYLSSTEDFPNPERGFYYPSNSDNGTLSSAFVAGLRTPYTPWQGSYQVHSTLLYRYFMLTPYVNSSIPNSFLTQIRNDLDAVRSGGAKVILRFSYTNTYSSAPYGDATKSRILQHIGQLSSIFEDHEDVIAAVQMGFIGIWGENYYTDHFGDASDVGHLTAANWTDRKDVLSALLQAVPSSRMIQVRYPQQKQKYLYGNNASTDPSSSSPLSGGQAYSGTDMARIGFHNDCFLASNGDFGTFTNYDPWSAAHATMITELRDYKDQDADYVVVGGETCSANVDITGDHECATDGGRADTDLALFNYSYLNSDYNNASVNNTWVGSCMDDIKKNLGYRFELQSGTFTNNAQAGQVIQINLSIKNLGYAAPFNARGIEYILKNTSTNTLYYASPSTNPQQWTPGSTTNINEIFCLPANIPVGSYALYLHLPDPQQSLYGNPDYSIRLANKLPTNTDVWEPSTGYNNLGHTIVVNNSASGTNCSGQTQFATATALPVQWLSFTVNETNNKQVVCKWQTNKELNNKGFWVERSIDGYEFEILGWVDAKTVASSINDYQWIDQTAKSNEKYYYRIQQIDWDENNDYSVVKSITIINEQERKISLYPNPVQNQLIISSLDRQTGQITIYNAQGQQIQTLTMNQASESLVDCSQLVSGWYFLRYQTSDDNIVKQFLKL